MPIPGTLDVSEAAKRAPFVARLPEAPWRLPGAEILQTSFEIEEEPALALIPPALHPSIPPYATLSVAHFPESPVGRFSLAQVRVVGRASIRPRGYLLRAVTDSAAAAEALSSTFGFTIAVGDAHLQWRHDRVIGEASVGGRGAMRIELTGSETISGSDVHYVASLHLARMREAAEEAPVLLQIDPEYVFHRAERGQPRVVSIDTDAWFASGLLRLRDGVAASYTRCDTDLPRVRFAVDPFAPAARGTRRLAA